MLRKDEAFACAEALRTGEAVVEEGWFSSSGLPHVAIYLARLRGTSVKPGQLSVEVPEMATSLEALRKAVGFSLIGKSVNTVREALLSYARSD